MDELAVILDDDAKEYVITRPDTPTSWSNYLGSTEYGAINHQQRPAAYGFYKSGARGRFLRLPFSTAVPMGTSPGDISTCVIGRAGINWSASWQPVGKPLEPTTIAVCRHRHPPIPRSSPG